MSDCGCAPPPLETEAQKRALWIALILNAVMFVVEVASGVHARSTGLIADGVDMLADAAAYAIALLAIGASARFKAGAAMTSGVGLLLVGLGLLAEVARRYLSGGAPDGIWMMSISLLALAVNVIVLQLLAKQRREEVHLRAAWLFTRADVIANAAVLLSGLAVLMTGYRWFDLVVGSGIALFVIREAFEIIGEAREASKAAD